jgi:hypothetical protein
LAALAGETAVEIAVVDRDGSLLARVGGSSPRAEDPPARQGRAGTSK